MGHPPSAGEFAEEVGFVHAVLEGFASVDEDDGDFVGELAAELFVAVDVDILPGEAATAMQFGEGLFDDLAEVTSFAGVDHDLAGLGHSGEFSKGGRGCASGIRRRARRAIMVSQRTRHIARLARILHGAKNACSG